MPNTTVLRKFIPYGAALVPGALASTLSFSADRYLVGYYLDLRQVGIYSVCFAVSALGFFLVGPLNDVLLPEMAALYDCGDWDGFRKRFSGVQKFVIGAAMLATAILVAFPQQILQLISNREFSSGGPTLTILGLQGLFMSIVMLYVVMLCVRMHVWWTTLVWGGMGVLVLVLDIILLPRIGIVGAAISQLVSSIVGAVVVVGMNCDIFHTTFRFRWLAQSGVALTGVWFVGHLLQGYPVSTVHSIEELAVGSAAFIGGLLATGYLEISDVGRIRDVLSRDFLKERQSSGMLLQRPR
jgi:O-antigen/teichoic acid export membrane protein